MMCVSVQWHLRHSNVGATPGVPQSEGYFLAQRRACRRRMLVPPQAPWSAGSRHPGQVPLAASSAVQRSRPHVRLNSSGKVVSGWDEEEQALRNALSMFVFHGLLQE